MKFQIAQTPKGIWHVLEEGRDRPLGCNRDVLTGTRSTIVEKTARDIIRTEKRQGHKFCLYCLRYMQIELGMDSIRASSTAITRPDLFRDPTRFHVFVRVLTATEKHQNFEFLFENGIPRHVGVGSHNTPLELVERLGVRDPKAFLKRIMKAAEKKAAEVRANMAEFAK